MADAAVEIIEEKPLSKAEKKQLKELEAAIEPNLKGFLIVGSALAAIHNERLYRESYDSFEDYCLSRWSFSRDFAYKQMRANEVTENIRLLAQCDKEEMYTTVYKVLPEIEPSDFDIVDEIPLPVNEAQVRPLTGKEISVDERMQVWVIATYNAKRTGQKLTARHVTEAIGVVKRKVVEKKVNDLKEMEKRVSSSVLVSKDFKKANQGLMNEICKECDTGWKTTSKQAAEKHIVELLEKIRES